MKSIKQLEDEVAARRYRNATAQAETSMNAWRQALAELDLARKAERQ